MLPEQAILEFKALLEKKLGKQVTMEEATEMAIQFFNFMKVVLTPANNNH